MMSERMAEDQRVCDLLQSQLNDATLHHVGWGCVPPLSRSCVRCMSVCFCLCPQKRISERVMTLCEEIVVRDGAYKAMIDSRKRHGLNTVRVLSLRCVYGSHHRGRLRAAVCF